MERKLGYWKRIERDRDRETGNQTEGKFSFGIFKKMSEMIATKKDADAISQAALRVFIEYFKNAPDPHKTGRICTYVNKIM